MDWQGWVTVAIVGLAFVAMLRRVAAPDIVLFAGAITAAILGIITPEQLLHGFSNPGMLAIAGLFVVAAGLRETGALDSLGRLVLRRAKSQRTALGRLCPQVALLSAFMNNTAIVAMLMPIVRDWCRRVRISPSRVLLPLSYAAVLGGTCTLIGTSTNLIVSGMMVEEAVRPDIATGWATALRGIGFFETAALGVPAVLLGLTYILLIGQRMLPDRPELLDDIGASAREYLVNMRVQDGSPLVGQQVKQAGLRRLPGLFLIEITRADRVIAPVTPNQELRAGDRLTFTGLRTTIVDLERFPGLQPLEAHDDRPPAPDSEGGERYYTEAVVSSTSPLIGSNIRESNFRALYNAAVIAVHRGGAHLTGRVGDIVLAAGDTLLLQTGPNFVKAHSNNPDFYLVSGVHDARPVRREKTWLAASFLGLVVVLMISGLVPVVVASLLGAALMIICRCISGGQARRGVSWNVLLTIAAALALGEALVQSGAAHAIARAVVGFTGGWGPVAAIAAIYLIAVLFTELVTNSAAAALVFPLAMSVAEELGVNPRPLAMAVVFGASFGFATPIGYQTNLMVFGPGGYRFGDFLKVGLPLNALLWILAVILIPIIWPLAQ